MATSLAQQLKKLALPETSIYKHEKRKASLLFDPKEAASIDRETFFEIGLSGLNELKKINPSFSIYENTLFDVTSKDFERAMQTKEANERLDTIIRSFLLKLSPYFLLQPAHKALEWLINRYQIHKYNVDDIFSLILPYHETKIFVRFLQILSLGKTDSWKWLVPLQKPGVPLAKITVYNHCASNVSFLKFITKMLKHTVKEFDEKADILTTLFAFYCSTVIGTLENAKQITEPILTNTLPGLLYCLSSQWSDLQAAGFIITGQLITKIQLSSKIAQHIVEKIFVLNTDLNFEAVMVLHLIFDTQDSIKTIPIKSIHNLTPPVLKVFCENLKQLIEANLDVSKLLLAFLKTILPLLQKDVECFSLYSNLPEIFLNELTINSACAEDIIKCVVECYQYKSEEINDPDSDIEMIDLNQSLKSDEIQEWYCSFMKSIERKFPKEFDKIVKECLKVNTESSENNILVLNQILGFTPKIVAKLGGSFLFEKLYHQNHRIRMEAVKYLFADSKTLLNTDKSFMTDSIIDRLNDDNPDVVLTILNSNVDKIIELTTLNVFSQCLKKIINNGQLMPEWWEASCKAIDIVISIHSNETTPELYFYVLPYIFPIKDSSVGVAVKLLKSPFGKNLNNNKAVNLSNAASAKDVSKISFEIVNKSKYFNRDSVLNILNSIDDDYLSALFLLMLLPFGNDQNTEPIIKIKLVKDVSAFLKKFNKFSINEAMLSGDTISRFIECAHEKKFPIECFIHFLERTIGKRLEMNASKWIDFCNDNPDQEFITVLYEIALDSDYKKYTKFRKCILKKIMDKNMDTSKDKIEFISNMVMRYQTIKGLECETGFLINSIKILHAMLEICNDPSCVLSSDIFISAVIISLNSSDSIIRTIALDIIKTVITRTENDDRPYLIFLRELNSRQEELMMDNNQLVLSIYALLSQSSSMKKALDVSLHEPMKSVMTSLCNVITDKSTPIHIKRMLNKALIYVNSADIAASMCAMTVDLLNQTQIDFYQSEIIIDTILRIDTSLVKNAKIWKFIIVALNSDAVLIDDENNTSYACIKMLEKIDFDFFNELSTNKSKEIIELIVKAGTSAANSQIISTAFKTIKRIELDADHFIDILQSMCNICKKSNSSDKDSNSYSITLVDAKEWKQGITMLEYIQNKKKLSGHQKILPMLFSILKKCLNFEDQSVVEYTKQLTLTLILNCCQKIANNEKAIKPIRSVIDIELIVLCIRGTQNPQTHQHALMVLSHIAQILPDQVLQHIMAIFTFIGSSVLRQDDAYCFQIINKIIETIIPILIKSKTNESNDTDEYVLLIMRIFVDAMLDIPEHRRLPLLKKLLDTLDADQYLWMFLGLIYESHTVHGATEKSNKHKHRLSEQQEPVRRLDLALILIKEFPPEIIMNNFNKLIAYVKTLPDERPEIVKPEPKEVIFSIANHTAKQLRHFKYTVLTFANNTLSSAEFIRRIDSLEDLSEIEHHYKTFIVNILVYIQRVSKVVEMSAGQPQAKYWKVLLHHCYEVLDNVNNLLSPEMFVNVIRGLMGHDLSAVKRKAMEVLNAKLQQNPTFFAECENNFVLSLLDPILILIGQINNPDVIEGISKAEMEFNQQTALLSLKLLVKLLCADNHERFLPILARITELTKSPISGNLMASVVLCLAELCINLKAYAIGSLPIFMPSLIKILKQQSAAETPEIVLLSIITAIYKIMEVIPLFLSPYLEKLIYHFSILSAKWDDSKSVQISTKLTMIKSKIAKTISPRVLIPVVSQCYNILVKKHCYDAIGPAMSILADNFAGVTGSEFLSLQNDLTNFFLTALQFRSDQIHNNAITNAQIDIIEEHIITALVALVLKLSESSFRPLYFKIYDWSVRNDDNRERSITFYKLSSHIANSLRGLFTLFAGHFVKNASDLLNACNKNKADELYFESEEKCCMVIGHILTTFTAVFTHDSQNFINKDRFETIMQPLIDQLDNTVGGAETLIQRAKDVIIPCVSQFAIATADDSLWKPLNYQILLKTRHNDPEIRLIGLECIREMATKLGDGWLPLLPESVPFLAELLEDEVPAVESATQKAIQTLESVLGEPLQKYF